MERRDFDAAGMRAQLLSRDDVRSDDYGPLGAAVRALRPGRASTLPISTFARRGKVDMGKVDG